MKKIIVAVLILAGSSTAFAQSQKGKVQSQAPAQLSAVESAAKNETDKWAKALSLTPDQKTQIHEVNLNVAKVQEQLKQAGPAASPERTTHLMKSKNSRYKAILTADQNTKYEKMSSGAYMGEKSNLQSN